jgi:tetratricopeptide (TPR) repeat protein
LTGLAVVVFAPTAGADPTHAGGRVVDLDVPTPPSMPAVTEAAAHALRTFDANHWSEAAIELQRVVSGDTGDAKAVRQLAQFDLAVALYRLKLFQASFAVFSEITSDPSHPMFSAALPWLAHLSEVLPEPADVIERIGKYSPKELSRFDNDDDRALYSELNYLLGRYEYSARNFEPAIACFDHVSKESRHYVEAKFFTGISDVALRQSAPAVQAFLDVEEALDKGSSDIEDPSRMRDLGYLSLARTYYSASVRLDGSGVPALDATRLSAAVNYWNKIDETSEYWLDAQFEESWAYFMAGDASRSMGNIHTIESPYFASGLYPEADVLKAVVYYTSCQYDGATSVADGVERTFTPIRKKLDNLFTSYPSDDAETRFFELAGAVHADKASLDADIAPMVKHALGDRELLRSIEYVKLLDDERGRLSRMTSEFRAAPIGSDVSDALDLAKAVAIKKAGTLARDRLRRTIGDLDEQLRNAHKVLVDVTDARRTDLEAEMRTVGGRPAPLPRIESVVEADEEHEVWPFDGEYWRDELGTYRQEIISKCR